MTTVPKCRFDIEACGGIYVDQPCVVDGNLVSGRTYHDHGHYIGPWIDLLLEAHSTANSLATPTQALLAKNSGEADPTGR